MDAKTLIEEIEETGRKVRSYSGRGMFGRQCVGVALDRYDYGSDLPDEGQRRDSLGLGEIVYWPSATWPEGRKERDV
jgi:hypothetical protein